jgi:hypothetical protein
MLVHLCVSRFGIISEVLEQSKTKNVTSEYLEGIVTKLNLTPVPTSKSSIVMSDNLKVAIESMAALTDKISNNKIRCLCALTILAACYNLKEGMELPAKVFMQLLGPTGKAAPLPSNTDYGHLIKFMLASDGIKALPQE